MTSMNKSGIFIHIREKTLDQIKTAKNTYKYLFSSIQIF